MREATGHRVRAAAGGMIAGLALMTAACGGRSVHQIVTDPSRYRDRDVRVTGDVVDSYSVASRGFYRIDDGTGRLWVVSERGVPREHQRVTVRGTLREGFNLGSFGDIVNLPRDLTAGVVLVESSHRTH